MTNEEKKYLVPVPVNSDISTGYITNMKDFKFIEVEEETYLAFYRPIWKTWKQMHTCASCFASDWKRCLGDCCLCPYHIETARSLDEELDDTDGLTLGDTIADTAPLVSEIMEQQAVLESLLNALQAIDPDGRKIGELLLSGKTKLDICREFGSSTSTFYKRFDRLKEGLKKYLAKN